MDNTKIWLTNMKDAITNLAENDTDELDKLDKETCVLMLDNVLGLLDLIELKECLLSLTDMYYEKLAISYQIGELESSMLRGNNFSSGTIDSVILRIEEAMRLASTDEIKKFLSDWKEYFNNYKLIVKEENVRENEVVSREIFADGTFMCATPDCSRDCECHISIDFDWFNKNYLDITGYKSEYDFASNYIYPDSEKLVKKALEEDKVVSMRKPKCDSFFLVQEFEKYVTNEVE